MPIKIEKMPDEPILQITAKNPIDPQIDLYNAIAQFEPALESAAAPIYFLGDARGLSLSFSELVGVLGTISHYGKAVFKHPNFAGLALVAENKILRMGVNALGQSQYGAVRVKTFATVDDALVYVRAEIAAHEQPKHSNIVI